MTYKIGIITYDARALPACYKLDDYLLKAALTRRGAEAVLFSWTNPHIEPTTFDSLVLRSCWDSHRNPTAFLAWLEQVEVDRLRLINPSPVVIWNYHKERYLSDLAAALRTHPSHRGQIVPSAFYSTQALALKSGSVFQSARGKSLTDILAELDAQTGSLWCEQDIIIKPTISASGDNTLRVVRTIGDHVAESEDTLSITQAEARLNMLLQDETRPGIIIQPLLAGIQNGEYSLIYIQGQFSHAVRKRVAKNDFKSRMETGRMGIHPQALPDGMLAFSDLIMALVQAQFPAYCIPYARIDMVQSLDGVPVLLECELIEPNLQFVRIPEIYCGDRRAPTEVEIKQGEIALEAAIGRFAEAIIAQTSSLQVEQSR